MVENFENTLLKFPCEFSVKAIGLASATLELEVLSIIKKHVNELKEDAITSRLSHNQRYLSLTMTFTAESKTQLDAIYLDLSASKHVLVAL